MNGIVNMIVRMVLRQVVNKGVNAGIRKMAQNGQGTASAPQDAAASKRLNQSAKAMRRITRL
ncbi:MAG: hypothetical protein AB8B47_11415 [Roseobacter sp.]